MEDTALLPSELHYWIQLHITQPIAGFEHKRKANGICYSREEQVKATRHQVILIALSYLKQGKSQDEIVTRLQWFCAS
jgi:hypothetical protein